jgi:hypothetical protein
MFSWNDKQAKRWGLPILPDSTREGKMPEETPSRTPRDEGIDGRIFDAVIAISGLKAGPIWDDFLIECPEDIKPLMDGPYLADNCFTNLPEQFGCFAVRVKVHFYQGYFEGYRADGESALEFEIISAIPLREELAQSRSTNRELNRRVQSLESSLAKESGKGSWYTYCTAYRNLYDAAREELAGVREELERTKAALEIRNKDYAEHIKICGLQLARLREELAASQKLSGELAEALRKCREKEEK